MDIEAKHDEQILNLKVEFEENTLKANQKMKKLHSLIQTVIIQNEENVT